MLTSGETYPYPHRSRSRASIGQRNRITGNSRCFSGLFGENARRRHETQSGPSSRNAQEPAYKLQKTNERRGDVGWQEGSALGEQGWNQRARSTANAFEILHRWSMSAMGMLQQLRNRPHL